ncbi:heavy metal translocating P-type ATPase [Natronomonas salsuginis]|uniref:Cation-translocating P-type ATPase n=1 Tax=Natronomonas salsuginis TaxID=2217661 RepID=A0A4U5JA58_9EURY|nr:cation-translocating P-type ATPase [Natronomonas salsuginis]TKR25066.1 cation-translocating P-type ATPase [Natronomonas salsuginis]
MTRTDDSCKLCDLPVAETGVADSDGCTFCCRGCRDVYDALGDLEDIDTEAVRRQKAADNSKEWTVPDDHESTFLEIEGMYCATCEAFIESAATTIDGVSGAEASYLTETTRIDHDPEVVTCEELCETVSGFGYSAYPRDDAFRQRQADNRAFARMAVGVLFGMMVMLQYIVIIYPTYFGGLFYDERMVHFLEEMMAGSGANYFFIVIAVLTTLVLLITGKPILRGAYVSVRTRSPNMDLLVAIAAVSAYLYSTVTLLNGGTHVYYDVTVAIVVIVTVGNYHESSIKRRATDLLSDLTTVQVDHARRLENDAYEEVPIEELSGDDQVLVREGERVPVDGCVVEGRASVDEAVVTGESLPVHKTPSDEVVGGSVVEDGAVAISVDEDPTNTLDRIENLVWNLQSSAHGIQKLADKLATIFVPLVLVLAVVVTTAYLSFGASIATALLIGLTVLIVSCPCALGLATPLAVASGIKEALERNIVVFDDTVFERLRGADTVVFDKTGTITTGDFEVVRTEAPDELLAAAARLEAKSGHPVAAAIAKLDRAATDGGITDDSRNKEVDLKEVEPFTANAPVEGVEAFESHAKGVSGIVDGTRLLVGHPDLFADEGWDVPTDIDTQASEERECGNMPILVGREGATEGFVVLGDTVREEWEETVRSLSQQDIDVVVLTGDDSRVADHFHEHNHIDRVFTGVPPEGKAETVARLTSDGQTVMVGDGTNDAPALVQADLGIALGGGTAMAIDAADIAIVDDDLRSVATVFELSTAAGRRVKENIGWAFCYNAIAIPLAITGLLNPLFAAAAMAMSSILVVTNSSRSLLSE